MRAADWELMASNPLIGVMPQGAQGQLEGAVDEAKKQQNLAQGAEIPPGAEGVLSSPENDQESSNSNDTEQQKAKEK